MHLIEELRYRNKHHQKNAPIYDMGVNLINTILKRNLKKHPKIINSTL